MCIMLRSTSSVAIKMVQWLSIFYTALGEDRYSVLSTHATWLAATYNSSCRETQHLWPLQELAFMCAQLHTHKHIQRLKIFKIFLFIIPSMLPQLGNICSFLEFGRIYTEIHDSIVFHFSCYDKLSQL